MVVIRVPERQVGQKIENMLTTVRQMGESYGIRVVIHGSSNSLCQGLLTNSRSTIMDVEPMSREQIETIHELKSLIGVLKANKIDGPVWTVLGGSPAAYLTLEKEMNGKVSQFKISSEEVMNQVKAHMLSILLSTFNKNILNCSKNTEKVIEVFRDRKVNKVTLTELSNIRLLHGLPDKVFRETGFPSYCMVPANAATSLIISENIRDADGVRTVLEKLFHENPK
jgi:hypothetical protein